MAARGVTKAPITGFIYRVALGVAIFTGMAQMPIMRRYYVSDIPGMGWSADFFITSNLHYLAALLLIALLCWRLVSQRGLGLLSWGPRTWWGWLLWALILISGVAKVMRNSGVFLDPGLIMALDFTHLGSAMAFMFTGLGVLFSRRGSKGAASDSGTLGQAA